MTHPHRDLIIALLDDPTLEVERRISDGTWIKSDSVNILVAPGYKYRICEKPKPDVVVTFPVHMQEKIVRFYPKDGVGDDNLRLTFTADGTLKNAEVL